METIEDNVSHHEPRRKESRNSQDLASSIVDFLADIRGKVWEIDGIIQGALLGVPATPSESGSYLIIDAAVQHSKTDWGEMARREYKNRRIRDGIFGNNSIFGEPAWDILLDLFVHEFECKLVSITSASIASCVPATTALRWLAELERKGLVYRQDDPNDSRRAFVRLTPHALDMIRSYLLNKHKD